MISWALIFISSLLSFFMLRILLSLPDIKTRNHLSARSSRPSICLFLLGTFLGQDCPSFPQVWSVRIFTSTWILFVSIMSSAYRSELVGFMASPVYEDPPETFAELVLNTDYKIGFMKQGDAVFNTLKSSTDPVYSKLYNNMDTFHPNEERNGTSLLACILLALQIKSACIGYDFTLNYLQHRFLDDSDIRKLETAVDSTYNDWDTMSFEGQSILKKTFEEQLRQVRPMHFQEIWDDIDIRKSVKKARRMDRLKKTLQAKKNKPRGSTSGKTSSSNSNAAGSSTGIGDAAALNLFQFVGAITSGAFGIALSIFVFIIELLASRRTRQSITIVLPFQR